MMLDQALLDAATIDPGAVDLDGADRVTYLLEQSFRYEYPQPVEAVKQRLVALPPASTGTSTCSPTASTSRAPRPDASHASTRTGTRSCACAWTGSRTPCSSGSARCWSGCMVDGPVRLPLPPLTTRGCSARPASPPRRPAA